MKMIDTNKYQGHTPAPWRVEGELTEGYNGEKHPDDGWGQSGESTLSIHGDGLYIGEIGADYGIHETYMNAQLMADAPLILEAYKRLRDGICGILSDYDITELIRDVPEDEWNFEQQALVRMKEMIE
jgi:hypothetical protein